MNRSVSMAVLALACAAYAAAADSIAYTIRPDQVVNRIDVGIHGQFLEHIFNSVHGGLWGDLNK